MMIWNLILINFMLLIGNPSDISEETIQFDIIHHNKIVGSLTATKIKTDSSTTYKSATRIKTRIIKEFRINYKYDVTFNNTFLEKADVNITVNEKPHAETQTTWKDSYYQITKDEKKENDIHESILYTTVQLYFDEPKNISTCFSEQDASFNTLEVLGQNSYKKINSKGNENIYYYEEGNLTKAIIDGGLIKFEMIRKM